MGLSFTFNNIIPISLYGLFLSGFDLLLVETFNNSVINEKNVFRIKWMCVLKKSWSGSFHNVDGFFTYEWFFSHMSDVRFSFILNNLILLALFLSGFDPFLIQTSNNSVIDKKVDEFADGHHEKYVFRKKWMCVVKQS